MIRVSIDLPKGYEHRLQPVVDLEGRFKDAKFAVGFNLPDADLRVLHHDMGVAELLTSGNSRLRTPVIIYERADSAVVVNSPKVRGLMAHSDVKLWLKRNTYRDYQLNNQPFLKGRLHFRQLNELPRFHVRPTEGEPPSALVTEEMASKVRMLPIVPIELMARFREAPVNWTRKRQIDVAFAGTVDYEVRGNDFWDGEYETALAATVGGFDAIIDEHRREAMRQLVELKHLRIFIGTNRAIRPDMYLEALLRSSISVSPWGLGEYGYRDYEAMLAGSILIKPNSDHIRTFAPDIYQSWKYYAPCLADFSDLADVVREVLSNRDRSVEVARAARDALLAENTPDKIFEYFLGLFNEALGRPSAAAGDAVDPQARTVAAPPSSSCVKSSESLAIADPDVINMVLVLGGAWALGANGDPNDTPATPQPEHPDHALMFNVGPVPRGRPVTKFVGLHERIQGSTRETPCSGVAAALMRRCQEEFGRKPQVVFVAVGVGGTTLSGADQSDSHGLMRGSQQHNECHRLVLEAARVAAAQGRRLRVLAVCLAHGESDIGQTSMENYRRGIVELRRTLDEDLRPVTNQTDSILMLTYQTNRGSHRLGVLPVIPLAQLRAGEIDPLVQCVGPVYCNDGETHPSGRRSAHLTSRGYRHVGLQFGRYLFDHLAGRLLQPLRAIACRWGFGPTLELDYSDPIALELDNSVINLSDLGPGLGIDFFDGSHTSPRIEAVLLSTESPSRLEIHLSHIPAGPTPRLFIASRLTGKFGCGRLEGARSGVRSREVLEIDPQDGQKIYKWACTEVVDVPPPDV